MNAQLLDLHTWGCAELSVTGRPSNLAVDILALGISLRNNVKVLSFCLWSCHSVEYPSVYIISLILLLLLRERASEYLLLIQDNNVNAQSSNLYLFLGRWDVRAWWHRWRCWDPEEILILLIINIPSVIGAAGKLMETRSLFRLKMVELGLGVFGIPRGDRQIDRWNKLSKRLRIKKMNNAHNAGTGVNIQRTKQNDNLRTKIKCPTKKGW